jgi:hypothetical protein
MSKFECPIRFNKLSSLLTIFFVLIGSYSSLLFGVSSKKEARLLSVDVSRTGTLLFALNRVKEPGRRHPYRTVFAALLKEPDFEAVLSKLNSSLEYLQINKEGYPENRYNYFTTEKAVTSAAYRASDISDFAKRVEALLPPDQLEVLLKAMHEFEPAFDSLLWQPSLSKLDSHKRAINNFLEAKSINSLLESASSLYGTPLPEGTEYTIYLNPIPSTSNFSTAIPIDNLLLCDLNLSNKKYEQFIPIAFHEICHTLFARQPLATQHRLSDAFFGSKTKTKQNLYSYPYFWLDEALATTLGAACYKKLTGQPDTSSWYNDPIINEYAHAIYPEVEKRLNGRKTIDDSAFANHCYNQFTKTFPNWQKNGILLLDHYTLACADSLMDPWRKAYFSHPELDSRSSYSSTPLQDEKSMEIITKNLTISIILIPAQIKEKTIAYYSSKIPSLGKALPFQKWKRIGKGTSYVFFTDANQHPWLLIATRKSEDLSELIKAICQT